ncbi:MAG: phosphopantetheine-binding protein, partial [Candidatus Tectomicrobia bacterium]
MTEFYNRIHNLSQQQRNLLALRLNQQPASAAAGQDDAEVPASQHRTKRLVAYAVVDQAQPLTAGDLRQFLDEKLPEYMVPAAFVFLDALPLNANGKVDRKALPEPNEVMPETEDTFVTPRTPVEETLAAIWAEVLGFDLVGVHDNFFEMGGDSILSIRIIARANRAGIRITPEQFFSNP